MKRIIVSLVLLLSLVFTMAAPVYAAPPEIVSYTAFRSGDGMVAGFTLNNSNLRVETLWIENPSPWDRHFYLKDHGEYVFEYRSPANSGYTEVVVPVNYKFMRVGPNDPDGEIEGTLQMMPNTSMGVDNY